MGRSFASRAGHNARISAAYDRAAAADRLQRALEDAGFTVERHPHSTGRDVSVHLDRGDDAEDLWFTGPTVFDALTLAVSDILNGGDR